MITCSFRHIYIYMDFASPMLAWRFVSNHQVPFTIDWAVAGFSVSMMILTLSIFVRFVRFNSLTRVVDDPFSKRITQRYGQHFFRLLQNLQTSTIIKHPTFPKTNGWNPKRVGGLEDDFPSMENGPLFQKSWVDVFPFEHGDIPASYLSFRANRF